MSKMLTWYKISYQSICIVLLVCRVVLGVGCVSYGAYYAVRDGDTALCDTRVAFFWCVVCGV